ncbi:MarR family transcriptional regulator [Bordetella genomosp. 5]|uniref:MarR family transcriptional regulator n=1 Tax=Bordetella genomosp. 5 TaxID=1395608 RepID=A0A261TL00_9BORD|nr:MarR family transcriptional regulator [Bordetella genomosp. 5]OZI42025.1 MarR family transcriptional regulator [Bordetella genomosp. 5]OZI50289.1 MarR family transcriptional regulator [Bordetella genomosp. 5]
MTRTPALRARRPAARGEHFEPHVAGLDYGVLDDLVGYAIRRAQITIYEDFLAALTDWDITPQRFSALTLIANNDGMKLTDLARALGIARSGAVQVVDQLQALGMVERRETPADRRAYALAVTASGRRALQQITAAVQSHDQRISARLAPAQRRQLIELLGLLG